MYTRKEEKAEIMKMFVSGGAGFIGSNLVDTLMEKGYQVTVYDNLSSGRKDFISQHFGKDGFTFIEGGLSDIEKLKDVMKGFECVFHFAANPDIAKAYYGGLWVFTSYISLWSEQVSL